MEQKIFKLKSNSDFGIAIDSQFNIWVDEYEGGNCYHGDWVLLDDVNEVDNYHTFDDAMSFVIETFGEVELIRTITEL